MSWEGSMNKRVAIVFILSVSLFLCFGCADKKGVKVMKKVIHQNEKTQANSEVMAQKEAVGEPETLSESVVSNPFLTQEEQKVFKDMAGRLSIDYLNLSAIFYSIANSRAIIDGRIFKNGDIVDKKEIVEIKPEEIILKDTQSVYVLKMKDVLKR